MPALALARPTDTERTLETTRFGPLQVDGLAALTFPDGLPGFEQFRRFVLVPHPTPEGEPASPFEWLQSLDDSALAFLAIAPHSIMAHYAPRLPQSDLAAIGLDSGEAPQLYALLTVPPGNPHGITANLLAPIAINPTGRLARQVIASDDQYSLRHRLLPE